MNMKCKCNGEFTEWKEWINKFPRYFQSIKNEIKECKNCGTVVFRYKPEGSEYRPEWTQEQRDDMDAMIDVVYNDK